MTLTLAAVGAVVAALLELTIVPYLQFGGAQPDLVLVLAVIWTIVAGVEGGLAAAFIGGLTLDFLAPRPLGSTAFTLLVTVGAAALLGRLFASGRALAAIGAVVVLSVVNSLLFLVVYGALRTPVPVDDPLGAVLPRAVYDGVLAALVAPLAVVVRNRIVERRERFGW
ncbi:MAG TPA: rod shape-determining protein MreD [Candidatus Limnocylindrales bacterium]